MGLFMWILIFQTLALATCSISENTNAELADFKKLLSQLVVKQNDMEKEMKQMRIKNEAMEVQISQLQFAYRQQRRYHYNNNKAVEKQLHEVQQENINLRIIISDLKAKQNELEPNVELKSTTASRKQQLCCEKEPRLIHKPMSKQFLGHIGYQSRSKIVNHKLSTANGFSDMYLHNHTKNGYLEKQSVEDKTIDKLKRLLIPVTSIPDNSKTVVAFQARPSHHISNVGDNQHLEFDSVIFSEGPEYDKTTGTFRCVVPGVYVFSVTLLVFPNKYLEAVIVRNGNPLAYMHGYGDNHYSSSTNMAIVRLDAGDRVWVRVKDDHHYSGTILDYSYTTFTGFLLQS